MRNHLSPKLPDWVTHRSLLTLEDIPEHLEITLKSYISPGNHGDRNTTRNQISIILSHTMPSLQPDPSQYTLRQITDLETIHYTRQQNAASWKGQLSEQDYVTREMVLGKSKITSDKLKVFILTSTNDNEPLLSVELLVRPAWKFVYDETTGKSVRKQILNGCIGGVFTYPKNRGKGLGKIMIDKLVSAAKEQYVGPDGYMFLYSEIGEYYTKNGFRSFGIDLMNIPMGEIDDTVGLTSEYELLNYHTFSPLLEMYAKQVDTELSLKTTEDKITRVSIVPSGDLIDWFHIRSKYISYKLHYEKFDKKTIDFHSATYEDIVEKFNTIDPQQFGLKISENGKLVGAIVWTYDWTSKSENYCTVLKIIIVPGNDVDSSTIKLLDCMRHHLKGSLENQTSTKIVVWECEVSAAVKQFLVDKWNTKTGIENSSRSALTLCDDKEQDLMMNNKLIWEGNDKLPWF